MLKFVCQYKKKCLTVILKSSSYTQYLRESGIMSHLIKKYFLPTPICDLYQRRPTDPIKLEDFSSILVLLVAGFVLSLVSFILELMTGLIKK